MLSTSAGHHHFKTTKFHEYILRRQARNLRAKVKALLPIQVCNRYSNRNKHIQEIAHSKDIWNSIYRTNSWKYTTKNMESGQQCYFQKPKKINRSQRFQKLTQQEIQQIKEDRLYYLGEDNLHDFQRYLRERSNKKRRPLTKLETDSSTKNHQTKRLKSCIQSEDKESDVERSKQITNVDCMDLVGFEASNKQEEERDEQGKSKSMREQFAERRKIIEFEQKAKKTTYKVKLDMKLERAEKNLRQIECQKWNNLAAKKSRQKEFIKKIKTKRENFMKIPEIKQIEEEMRRTCLTRMGEKRRALVEIGNQV